MSRLNRSRAFAVFGAVAAMAVAGNAFAATSDFPPSVTVLNQKMKGDAVSVTYAYLPKDGTLAILSGDPAGNARTKIIGSLALQAGDHRDFKVPLKSEPKTGTRLWATVEQAKTGQPFKNSDERATQSFKTL